MDVFQGVYMRQTTTRKKISVQSVCQFMAMKNMISQASLLTCRKNTQVHTWRATCSDKLKGLHCFLALISAPAVRKGQPNLSKVCMELITSKELLPGLISAHEQDASFISLHLQDKSLPCWQTKATHRKARWGRKTRGASFTEINNKNIWLDEYKIR